MSRRRALRDRTLALLAGLGGAIFALAPGPISGPTSPEASPERGLPGGGPAAEIARWLAADDTRLELERLRSLSCEDERWETCAWTPSDPRPGVDDYRGVAVTTLERAVAAAPEEDLWLVLLGCRHRPRRSLPLASVLHSGWPRQAGEAAADPASVRVLLVDSQGSALSLSTAILATQAGVPLGNIHHGEDLWLSTPFRGFVLARDFLPTPVSVDPSDGLVRVELRRAAHAAGRLIGAFVPGPTLLCTSAVDPRCSKVVDIDAQGKFELRDFPAGPVTLEFAGRAARTPADVHRFVLREGVQHLGVIDVPALGDIDLEVLPRGRRRSACFVSAYMATLPGGEAEASKIEYCFRDVDDLGDGCWRVRGIPPGRIGGWAWTPEGEFGTISEFSSLANAASIRVPVAVALPGCLRVSVIDMQPALAAGSVVVADAAYGLSIGEARRRARAHPHARVREAPLTPSGIVNLDSLWPRTYVVGLLSRHGVVAAEARVTVVTNTVSTCDLQVREDCATLVIECGATGEPARCALVRSDSRSVVRGRPSSCGI